MEVVITAAVLIGLAMVFISIEAYNTRREEQYFMKNLKKTYGKEPNKKYSLERFDKIGSYYKKHQTVGQIDDITWNDLSMDDIFMRMDYSLSATGEEYLYYRLRTPMYDNREMDKMEQNIRYFTEHEKERVQLQLQMRKLGFTGKYSLYDYLDNLENLGKRSNWKHYLLNALYIPAICAMAFEFSAGLMAVIIISIVGIVTYYKEKGEIDPYIVSFAFVMRLYLLSGEVEKLKLTGFERELELLQKGRNSLKKMYRGSFWVMSAQRGNATGGNPIEMIMDYFRMVFHLDLMKFNKMLHALKEHYREVDDMITAAGYLECMISIGAYRASLTSGYCVPEFVESVSKEEKGPILYLEQGYHPLLQEPVKNTIEASGSILLTGSNASGKSTFLKTVAISAILAQTTHTVTADCYRAPFFRIFSSMSLRDSLLSGESYYIVEIKAIKRILEEVNAGDKQIPVLCFVDEVLRGTNTIERIAAASHILRKLSIDGALCFAATHDIEMTDLLTEYYTNYHFSEEIKEGDIVFDYLLRKGRAGSRNAIGLLKLLGYPREITDRATDSALRFEESGLWQL